MNIKEKIEWLKSQKSYTFELYITTEDVDSADVDIWGSAFVYITIDGITYGVEYNLCKEDNQWLSAIYKLKPFEVDYEGYIVTDYDDFISAHTSSRGDWKARLEERMCKALLKLHHIKISRRKGVVTAKLAH